MDKAEHMSNMVTLEKELDGNYKVVCKVCGSWTSKWASSFNGELKYNCRRCKKPQQWEKVSY